MFFDKGQELFVGMAQRASHRSGRPIEVGLAVFIVNVDAFGTRCLEVRLVQVGLYVVHFAAINSVES